MKSCDETTNKSFLSGLLRNIKKCITKCLIKNNDHEKLVDLKLCSENYSYIGTLSHLRIAWVEILGKNDRNLTKGKTNPIPAGSIPLK